MEYKRLNKSETNQLKEYISYASHYLAKLKSGKEINFRFLGDIGSLFPEPWLVLRRVSLDSPFGLYSYFKGSIEKFSEILRQKKISKEEALELRLTREPELVADLIKMSGFGFDL